MWYRLIAYVQNNLRVKTQNVKTQRTVDGTAVGRDRRVAGVEIPEQLSYIAKQRPRVRYNDRRYIYRYCI